MVTNFGGEKMDLASLPVNRIRDLVNNNVNRLLKIPFHDYFKNLKSKIFFASLRSAQMTY